MMLVKIIFSVSLTWDAMLNITKDVLQLISDAGIIVIRNGKIVWKHGPNRPFFLYNLSSENY